MTDEIVKTEMDASALEQVLVGGDLGKLSPAQRVQYYRRVCESIGLNPFTKPFEYIILNGKMTLYARKDCADQLRSIKGVSIDDVDLTETNESFIVKVKGHDSTGRSDVEIGIVKKSDMQGNTANAQMKAVTKAKRRFTLSLCGLGWLDETEIETIKDAHPVTVAETGEIVEAESAVIVEMTLLEAMDFLSSDGRHYNERETKELKYIAGNPKASPAQRMAARLIIDDRAKNEAPVEPPEDPQ